MTRAQPTEETRRNATYATLCRLINRYPELADKLIATYRPELFNILTDEQVHRLEVGEEIPYKEKIIEKEVVKEVEKKVLTNVNPDLPPIPDMLAIGIHRSEKNDTFWTFTEVLFLNGEIQDVRTSEFPNVRYKILDKVQRILNQVSSPGGIYK